jgi:hypothetical protein
MLPKPGIFSLDLDEDKKNFEKNVPTVQGMFHLSVAFFNYFSEERHEFSWLSKYSPRVVFPTSAS